MHINKIQNNYLVQIKRDNNYYNKQPAFKAVPLRDHLILHDKSGKMVEAALIELELDPRELIADRRYRHRDLIPAELRNKLKEKKDEVIKFLEEKIPTEDYYTGDINFLSSFANRDTRRYGANPAQSIMNNALVRNQYPNFNNSFITIGEYWKNISDKGYNANIFDNGNGLLRKELVDYVTTPAMSAKIYGKYYNDINIDNFIYDNDKRMRQRVLMLVESNKDGNYRYLPPSTKVYGIAEIYTDRAADIIEDILNQQNSLMAHSTCKNLGIKYIHPTEIRSFFVPTKPESFNGNDQLQNCVNNILDIDECEDAAKILLSSIEEKSRCAGLSIQGSVGCTYGFIFKNGYSYLRNKLSGMCNTAAKNGLLELFCDK